MATRYRPANIDRIKVSPLDQLVQDLPTIVSQFMNYASEQNRTDAEWKRRESWRDIDHDRNLNALEADRTYKQNLKFRSELHALYNAKITDFETKAAEYSELAGPESGVTDLNHTDEYNRILETSRSSALTELTSDISAFTSLIEEVDSRLASITERRMIMNSISYEQVAKSSAYKKNLVTGNPNAPTVLESSLGTYLWDQSEVGDSINDILTDNKWRTKNGLNIIDSQHPMVNPAWLTDYVTAISNPGDPKLAELNNAILLNHTNELKAQTAQDANELAGIEHDIKSDPNVIIATKINAIMATYNNTGEGLLMMNDFANNYNKALADVKFYDSKIYGNHGQVAMNIMLGPEHPQSTYNMGISMMRASNVITDTELLEPEVVLAWTKGDKDSKTIVANYLVNWSTNLGYKKPKEIPAAEYANFLLSEHPTAKDIREKINDGLNRLGADISKIIPPNVDLKDNDFMKVINKMKNTEGEVNKLLQMAPDEFHSNTYESGDLNEWNLSAEFNEQELIDIAACSGTGGFWTSGTGCTPVDFNDMDLTSSGTNAAESNLKKKIQASEKNPRALIRSYHAWKRNVQGDSLTYYDFMNEHFNMPKDFDMETWIQDNLKK